MPTERSSETSGPHVADAITLRKPDETKAPSGRAEHRRRPNKADLRVNMLTGSSAHNASVSGAFRESDGRSSASGKVRSQEYME